MSLSYTAGTFSPSNSYPKKAWLLIDAKDMILGRLASRVAILLRGKHKSYYTASMDCGDNVVIINARHVKLTGKKLLQNSFFWHSGYPGGIKERSFGDILSGEHPERLLRTAIRRMMPKESPLARKQLKSLYVYPDDSHMHEAQKPEHFVVK